MAYMSDEEKAILKERAKELRKNMTQEEKHLWYDYLSGCTPLFHRQTVLDGYIVDFYCPKLKLIIEIDGSQHYMGKGPAYDAKRTAVLEFCGRKVVRFTNREIHEQFEAVCRRIDFLIHGES